MTLDLFASNQESDPLRISMPDADVTVWQGLFDQEDSDAYLRELVENIAWSQECITLYGETHKIPRLTAWYGDADKKYCYSGIELESKPWTPLLTEIKGKIEQLHPSLVFNSVLFNLYRSGADCVAWHSDDEAELGPNPAIGSVTFGASRPFQLKHREKPSEKRSIRLGHGDYLLMQGVTQRHWLHQIPRTRRRIGPRLNLTFRRIVE